MPPASSGRSGFGGIRALIIIMTLVITGGTVVIFLMVGNEVSDVIDQIPSFSNPFAQGTDSTGGGGSQGRKHAGR